MEDDLKMQYLNKHLLDLPQNIKRGISFYFFLRVRVKQIVQIQLLPFISISLNTELIFFSFWFRVSIGELNKGGSLTFQKIKKYCHRFSSFILTNLHFPLYYPNKIHMLFHRRSGGLARKHLLLTHFPSFKNKNI